MQEKRNCNGVDMRLQEIKVLLKDVNLIVLRGRINFVDRMNCMLC